MSEVYFRNLWAVKLLVQKSKSLNLDLNKAQKNGMTAFHTACNNKHEEIVDYLIANSEEFGINLLAEVNGYTGYHLWPEKFPPCESVMDSLVASLLVNK